MARQRAREIRERGQTSVLSVRLPRHVLRELMREARRQVKGPATLARHLIEEGLGRLERASPLLLAERLARRLKEKELGVESARSVARDEASAHTEPTLHDAVQRIVKVAKPQRIILFGSTARGEAGIHSDVDLLIVVRDGTPRRETARAIHRALAGLGLAKDVVVVTETDVHRHGGEPSLVVYPALREGKELYRAAG